MSGRPETKPRRVDWRRLGEAFAASLAASLLTWLSFPPASLWWLSFAAPVPLLWAAERAGERRLSAALGAAAGAVPLWAWQQQWIFGVSAPGATLLVLYLSFYAGAVVLVGAWLSRRLRAPVWALWPVLWCAAELLRGRIVGYGYPWLLTGHPLIESPLPARAGSVIGAYGVSLLTVAMGAAAWGAVRERGRRRLVAGAALCSVIVGWGALSTAAPPSRVGELRVAVVQTNVPQSVKGGWSPPERLADLDRMLEMTIEAARAEPRPDVIVWPETMFPGAALDSASLETERAARLVWFTDAGVRWPPLEHVLWRGPDGTDEPFEMTAPIERGGRLAMPTIAAADSLLVWQERLGVPILVGAEGVEGLRLEVSEVDGTVREENLGRFNSSYLIVGGQARPERYDKLHLTPFGEVMPYVSTWDWLESLFLRVGIGAAGMEFDLEAGERPVSHELPTEAGPVRVATPICFEGIMPGVCRRLAYEGGGRRADLLVQMTNEGWFGGFDPAREQHLQILRWRAVELGLSVVRAANTGVSALIDPAGRVLGRGVQGGDSNASGVLAGTVPLAAGGTVYGRLLGDSVAWAALAVSGGLVAAGVWRGRGQSRRDRRTDKRVGEQR